MRAPHRRDESATIRHRYFAGLAFLVSLGIAAATPQVSSGALATAVTQHAVPGLTGLPLPSLSALSASSSASATATENSAPATTSTTTTTTTSPTATSAPGASVDAHPDPFAGVGLYASAWDRDGVSRADIAGAAPIFDQPQAEWLYGDEALAALTSQVHTDVAAAAAQNQMPVLVAYNIPGRDCGSYSVGGTADAEAYAAWIDAIAAGIGDDLATIILEPDALAQIGCLDSAAQRLRYAELRGAIQRLREEPNTAVYLDAGNANWQPASLMISRLEAAGVAAATGFSLNVSNFDTTANEEAYGATLSVALGGEHFVVDTGRNGAGPPPAGDWCNPSDMGLGVDPRTATGDPLVDALLWIKNPGRSDGACAADEPPAGKYWPDYAQGLIARAEH